MFVMSKTLLENPVYKYNIQKLKILANIASRYTTQTSTCKSMSTNYYLYSAILPKTKTLEIITNQFWQI
jgi:hypothetical protein